MAALVLRDATDADVAAITAIYNDIVATSSAIWRDDPTDEPERAAWVHARQDAGMAVVVADLDGQVVGYAGFGPFRPFPGYHAVVEHSIHLADGHRGQGIGQALLDELVTRAIALDKAVLIGGIDGANEGSIRFHLRNGFREVARMPGIGRKWGQPVDLLLYQRELA